MASTRHGIIADLEFLTTGGGGRRTSPPNPAGGHLRLFDDQFVTCTIAVIDDSGAFRSDVEQFQFGATYRVLIVPLVTEQTDLDLHTVEVFEGRRLVARGSLHQVIEVEESVLRSLRRPPLMVESVRLQDGPIVTLTGTGWSLALIAPWTATIGGVPVDSEADLDESLVQPLIGQEFLGFDETAPEGSPTDFRFSGTTITLVPDDPAWEPYVLHLPTGIHTGGPERTPAATPADHRHRVGHARTEEDLVAALAEARSAGAVDASWAPLLARLVREDWHHLHEELVFDLADLRDPGTVDTLIHATRWVPDHLAWDDNRGLAVKAIWGLRKNPSPAAGPALIALTASDESVIAENARDRLLDRIEDAWLPQPATPHRTVEAELRTGDRIVPCTLEVSVNERRCELRVTAPDGTGWAGKGLNLWYALLAFRRALEEYSGATLLVQASRPDVHPSRHAEGGAYVLAVGQPWSVGAMVDPLAPAGPRDCGTIADQERHQSEWLASLLPWPAPTPPDLCRGTAGTP